MDSYLAAGETCHPTDNLGDAGARIASLVRTRNCVSGPLEPTTSGEFLAVPPEN
jgi:hypothetical protein